MKRKALLLALSMILIVVMCSCGKPLSKSIVGTWNGQLDVAALMYNELGDELGIDLHPEPVYSSVSMVFEENGTGIMVFDKEEFAQAVGDVAEPFVSGFFDVDTDWLIDILMAEVSKDMDSDMTEFTFEYSVNDDKNMVYLTIDGDTEEVLYEDGMLYFEEDGIGIQFEKE